MDAVELDEAGNIVAEYSHAGEGHGGAVVAVAVKDVGEPVGILQSVINIFLPSGYPNSVTEDYLEYQIYDSLQAFSSSIAGLLSSRAVLEGIGVGDSTASTTSAVLLSILQDSIGRLATIIFAWRLGTSIEPECKRYRYAADIFNDSAMLLDCLSPALPKPLRVATLCFAGCMRALCGVAGGGSKASLSVHFAKWNNVGELNAKDSSQETVIGLTGMLAGSLVVSRVTSVTSTWLAMLFLVGVHLYTNYRAVRAVTMRTLNRQRANIAASHFYDTRSNPDDGSKRLRALSPKEVAAVERIFESDGVLRWQGRKVGYGAVGCKLSAIITSAGTSLWKDICDVFGGEEYVLWHGHRQGRFVACLTKDCEAKSQLKAWTHMLLLARDVYQQKQKYKKATLDGAAVLDVVRKTMEEVESRFDDFVVSLEEAGWDVGGTVMETVSGYRVQLLDSGKKQQ